MKNVTKERDFIYRLPFACVCTLINKDALINEDVFKHMHRTSRHKSVLTTLQHHLHLYNIYHTHHIQTMKMRNDRKASISGQQRRDNRKVVAGVSEGGDGIQGAPTTRLCFILYTYYALISTEPRGEGVNIYPSPCHYFCYDMSRRVYPSLICCYSHFDLVRRGRSSVVVLSRRGGSTPPLHVVIPVSTQ